MTTPDERAIPSGRADTSLSRRALVTAGAAALTLSACTRAGRGQSTNVRDVGAVGDGLTDDTAAFIAGLERAAGSTLTVPEGTYVLSETNAFASLVPTAGTTMSGPGTLRFARRTRKSVRLIRIENPDISLQGLSLDLRRAPRGTSFGVSVVRGAHSILLNELTLTNNPHRGGVQILGGSDLELRRCSITGMKQNGVTLYGRGTGDGPRGITIMDCHISSDVQPIDSEPVEGATVQDLRVEGCRLVARDNYAVALAWVHRALVANNSLVGAVHVVNSRDITLRENRIDATAAISRDAVTAVRQSDRCQISGNTILAARGRYAISLRARAGAAPNGWVIDGNTMRVSDGVPAGLIDGGQGISVNNNILQTESPTAGSAFRLRGMRSNDVVFQGNQVDGFDGIRTTKPAPRTRTEEVQ
ncbi:right-handed parallel beta-helix repeat-containing protein [Serinicoccus hydrothermalis]|uniref:right-handed parallel beta-helix repeat-containing protein n=1 Tax=Serinicoccus hydrothermalis TaxID=1758689 RepID=UPI0008310CC5|nr:right-handed parallel beta-helix repeat-containing protein [Serinicoccus hydrothermalis]